MSSGIGPISSDASRGVLRALDDRAAGVEPYGHRVQQGHRPGVVALAGYDVLREGNGGQFGHAVRLDAQLTARGDELGGAVAQPAAAQVGEVVEPRVQPARVGLLG